MVVLDAVLDVLMNVQLVVKVAAVLDVLEAVQEVVRAVQEAVLPVVGKLALVAIM